MTSKLAAFIGIAHIEVQDYLDHESDKASKPFEQAINTIVTLANRQPPLPPYQLEHEIRQITDQLPNAVGKHIYDALIGAGNISANQVVVALVKGVPMGYMPLEVLTQEAFGGAVIKAVIKRFTKKEPAVALTKQEVKRRFHSLLIEPIKKLVLEKIVLGGAAKIAQLMQYVKQSVSPRRIADILVKKIASGADRRQQAQALRDELGMPKAAAKRLVRTEGARVATESNMAAFDELGTAVIGFMVHATPNPDSRWWHRQRSGTIYYKDPLPGQKGLAQMPRPPLEAEDPAERPEDAPAIAHNCLCYVSPVFQPLDNLDGKFGHTADDKLVPDILVYSDWYKQAPERLQRKSVGSRRYDAVTSKHGADASYFYYINPDTGELLSLEQIALETEADTISRVTQARIVASEARKRRRDVLLFGSVQG